jgi:hypothetical protein
MMSKQIAFLLAIFVVLCALFVIAERTLSPSFQQCVGGAEENPSAYGVTVSYARCTTAFVFATGIAPFWERTATGQYNWRFRPIWQNSGDTPTKDMRMHTSCELRNTPLPSGFDFGRATTQVGTGFLGPRATTTGSQAPNFPMASLTPQNLRDVQQGTLFLYLWGWVRYFDVFPNTKEHITRFCWLVMPVGDPFTYVPDDPQHTLRFTTIHQTEGNCADDECR